MIRLLALHTATESCSVALVCDGEVRQLRDNSPRSHARQVLPMVEKLLATAGITPGQLDALAFSAGPGSFTGLRIGFGVVQGLAYGLGLPVVPVSTLEAMALTGAQSLAIRQGTILPALDARMGELYWGLYHIDNGIAGALVEDSLGTPDGVSASGPVTAGVGSGWAFADSLTIKPEIIDKTVEPDAATVLDIALRTFDRGGAMPVETVNLRYLRDELAWKKRTKIRKPA